MKIFILTGMLAYLMHVSSIQAIAQEDPMMVNDPARIEEFMDWGLGMFVHWSFDSQLGSVISHSMVGASEKYVELSGIMSMLAGNLASGSDSISLRKTLFSLKIPGI